MAFKEIPFDDWRRIEAIVIDKIDEDFVHKHNLVVSPPIPVDLDQAQIVGFGPSRYLVHYVEPGFTRIFWVNEDSVAEPVAMGPDIPTPRRGQIVRLRRPLDNGALSLIAGHLFEVDHVFVDCVTLREVSDIRRRCNAKRKPLYIQVDDQGLELDPMTFITFFWRNYEPTDYAMDDAKAFMRDFRERMYPPVADPKPAASRRSSAGSI